MPYVLTSIKGITTYYLWRFVVPASLSVDPDIVPVTSSVSFGFLASLSVLVCLTLVALSLRKRRPMAAVGLVLILVSPLTAYCVFPLADVLAEHRAYMTMLGVVILMADVFSSIPQGAIISIVVVTAYVWGSIERNKVWLDEVLLWEDASFKAPEKIRPRLNLGALHQAQGATDAAVRDYQFVLARAPENSSALANLGSIYLEKNNLATAEDLLNRAVAANSRFAPVYLNLGVVRLRQGRLDEALELLKHAVALNPNQLVVHFDIGDVLFRKGQPDQAISEYLAELDLNRSSAITHLHLAAAYEAIGTKDKAIEEYRTAARLDPANPQAQTALEKLQQVRSVVQ
jgi:Tfp pilus assembly protein PilF